jgi:hypothetical protein
MSTTEKNWTVFKTAAKAEGGGLPDGQGVSVTRQKNEESGNSDWAKVAGDASDEVTAASGRPSTRQLQFSGVFFRI